jgi:hypothetical protein
MTPALRLSMAAVLAAPVLALAAPVPRPSDGDFQKQLAAFVEAKSGGRIRLVGVATGSGRAMKTGNLFALQDAYQLDFVAVVHFEADGFTTPGADEYDFEDFELLASAPEAGRGRAFVPRAKGTELDVVGSALFAKNGKLAQVRPSRAAGHAEGRPRLLALHGRLAAVVERVERDAASYAQECAKFGQALLKHAAEDAAVVQEVRQAKPTFIERDLVERIYAPRLREAGQGEAVLEACQEDPGVKAYSKKSGRLDR